MLENMSEGQKVVMRNGEYEFLVTRHPKFQWLIHGHEQMYFLYIIRKQEKIINLDNEVRTFNILCHLQMFINYFQLFKTLQPVLEEYVLEDSQVTDFILEVREMCYNDSQLQIQADLDLHNGE